MEKHRNYVARNTSHVNREPAITRTPKTHTSLRGTPMRLRSLGALHFRHRRKVGSNNTLGKKKKSTVGTLFFLVEVWRSIATTLLVTLRASIVSQLPLTSLARRTPFSSQTKSRVRITATPIINKAHPKRMCFVYGRSVEIRTPGLQFPNKYAIVF